MNQEATITIVQHNPNQAPLRHNEKLLITSIPLSVTKGSIMELLFDFGFSFEENGIPFYNHYIVMDLTQANVQVLGAVERKEVATIEFFQFVSSLKVNIDVY